MRFSQIAGQEKQISDFLALKERVPHSFIVSGAEGSGTLLFALAISQWIFCTGKKESDVCGECKNCRRMDKLEHPDFHFSMPVVNPKSDKKELKDFAEPWKRAVLANPYLDLDQWLSLSNKEGKLPNISADAVREILQGLSLLSYEGGAKIHLVWLAEYMGKESNRLLKLIEEPPENTYLILVTENLDKILPTILSRCQSIQLFPLGTEEISSLLRERGLQNEEEIARIARWANGSINQALFLISDDGVQMSKLWLDWLRLAFQPKSDKLVRWVNKTAGLGRAKLQNLLAFGSHYLREVMYTKVLPPENPSQGDELNKSAWKMANFLSVNSIEKIKTLLETYSYYIERNANNKILLMDLSLRIGKILTSDFLLKKKK